MIHLIEMDGQAFISITWLIGKDHDRLVNDIYDTIKNGSSNIDYIINMYSDHGALLLPTTIFQNTDEPTTIASVAIIQTTTNTTLTSTSQTAALTTTAIILRQEACCIK